MFFHWNRLFCPPYSQLTKLLGSWKKKYPIRPRSYEPSRWTNSSVRHLTPVMRISKHRASLSPIPSFVFLEKIPSSFLSCAPCRSGQAPRLAESTALAPLPVASTAMLAGGSTGGRCSPPPCRTWWPPPHFHVLLPPFRCISSLGYYFDQYNIKYILQNIYH
jgi:hypothetical protein